MGLIHMDVGNITAVATYTACANFNGYFFTESVHWGSGFSHVLPSTSGNIIQKFHKQGYKFRNPL